MLSIRNSLVAALMIGASCGGTAIAEEAKGFYLTVKLSTDATTNLGGEKQLFSVGTNYEMNNRY